jgi:hypothetical protein
MKKLLWLLLVIPLIACPTTPLEQGARNTAAALQGALQAAQTQFQTTCTSNPKQTACTVINQAVAGQNALITATEAYCGWSQAVPPPSTTATCVPVKSAQAGLTTAIANANLFVTELKGVIQ